MSGLRWRNHSRPQSAPLPGRRRQSCCRPAASAARPHSTAVARPRSSEVLGVVIVDAGLHTPEGEDLLLDFASCYG